MGCAGGDTRQAMGFAGEDTRQAMGFAGEDTRRYTSPSVSFVKRV